VFLERHIENFDSSNKEKVIDVVEPEYQVYYRPKLATPSSILSIEQVRYWH